VLRGEMEHPVGYFIGIYLTLYGTEDTYCAVLVQIYSSVVPVLGEYVQRKGLGHARDNLKHWRLA
jgi:hypothetical protein